jgi:5,5'-dehydrodivanillate O-demethylase
LASKELNERLARVGPGTPCGELMRRYWIPVAPAAQLDEEPVRKIRILGEDLVLFKSASGELGLIGERCLHRAVDLQWGFPDERGLRCPYHGWLYAPDGQCLERPLEDASTSSEHLKLPAYPVKELGGLIFAYMGPLPAPLLPPWDLFVWPNAIRQIGINVLDCNWLQCHENTGDPAHSVWLHGHYFDYILKRIGDTERAASQSHTLHTRIKAGAGIKDLYARPTRYGLEKGMIYSKALGADSDRVSRHSTVIFPFYTQVGSAGQPRSEFQIRVPIDDTHTYHICYQVYAAPEGVAVEPQASVPYYTAPMWDQDGKPIADYVLAQDALVWPAQGEITDRTQEHLGRTDKPIVFLRAQLDEQIRIVERGDDPMNVFRSKEEMGDILFGGEAPAEGVTLSPVSARALYHTGAGQDDSDRYGPLFPEVVELHRRIAEHAAAK